MKDRKCTVRGCEQKFFGKGMCKQHYMADWRSKRQEVVTERSAAEVWADIAAELGVSGASDRKVGF
jgi:hypothetical protein